MEISNLSKRLDRVAGSAEKLDRIRKLTLYYNQKQFIDAPQNVPNRLDTCFDTSFSSKSHSVIWSAKKSIRDWDKRFKNLRTSVDQQSQNNEELVHSLHDSILSSFDREEGFGGEISMVEEWRRS